VNLACKT